MKLEHFFDQLTGPQPMISPIEVAFNPDYKTAAEKKSCHRKKKCPITAFLA
jgi:hypothetical protein